VIYRALLSQVDCVARRWRIRRMLVSTLAGLALVAGVGTALAVHSIDSSSTKIRPLTYAKRVGRAPVVRRQTVQGRSPNELLDLLMARLAAPAMLQGEVSSTPAGYRATEDPNAVPPPGALDGPWAHLRVLVPDAGVGSMLPLWQADLLVGDLREEMHIANASSPLFGEAITLVTPSGSVANTINTNIGDIAYGQQFSDASDAAIRSSVERGAAAAGVSLKSITVLNGLNPAPRVVVAAANPAQYVSNADMEEHTIFHDPRTYEGVYLEVDDSSGDPVLISWSSFRTGIGQTWIRPDLAGSPNPTDNGALLP